MTSRRNDVLPWIGGYLDGYSPLCVHCEQTCIGCDGVIRLDDGVCAHFDCYKQMMPSIEEMKARHSMVCLVCGQPCDSSEDAKELAIGQAIHSHCYDAMLRTLDLVIRPIQKPGQHKRLLIPRADEVGMTPSQIFAHRYRALFPRKRRNG